MFRVSSFESHLWSVELGERARLAGANLGHPTELQIPRCARDDKGMCLGGGTA